MRCYKLYLNLDLEFVNNVINLIGAKRRAAKPSVLFKFKFFKYYIIAERLYSTTYFPYKN